MSTIHTMNDVSRRSSKPRLVVIGGSAGAVQSLLPILAALASGFSLPIAVVIHIPPRQNSCLVSLVRDRCSLDVTEVEDKMPIVSGTVYIAPPDYHVLVEPERCFSLSSEEPVNYSRPSIDVLFESAADAFEDELMGIILTGANDDGARGLQRIRLKGGRVVVQEPSLAYAQAMPVAAHKLCPDASVFSPAQIASHLNRLGC